MKILSLHGDHYQMGLQHGRQVSDLRPLILTTLGARLEALTRSGGMNATRLDELRRAWASEPDARATTMMLQGIADALEIPRERMFQYVAASYLEDLLLTKTQSEGCTVWAASRAATRAGVPLLAKNRDFYEAHIPMRVIAYAAPREGYRYIYATSAGSPGVYSSGMNECGLAIADTHVSSRDLGPGLARFSLMMNILERCARTADALAYLQSVRCMGAGNLTLADADGACAVVENGFRVCGFITPLQDIIVATNHFVSAELCDANVFRNSTTYDETRARYATARALLEKARGAIDSAYAKRVAAHHDTTALCRHRPLNDADTISAAIYLPAQRRLLFCNGWPCQGSYETYRL
jgi:predicted choloylglycine hydrolase